MGRHSSDSDSSYHRSRSSKKHRKRRSRSPSYSSDESRSVSRSKKSKKKHRHRSRSRSRSRESSHRRRRSYSRSRSRSYSPHRHRRRSRSRSRKGHRSRSNSYSRDSSRASSVSAKPEKKHDPCSDIPGFDSLPSSKQAELRLQMALKAAAAADQKLQERGLLGADSSSAPSFEEQQKRAQDIDEIESESFEPAAFMSSRSQPTPKSADNLHADAIFSSTAPLTLPPPPPMGQSVLSDHKLLFGPNFLVPMEEKNKRWMKKLNAMRKKKLDGVAMS